MSRTEALSESEQQALEQMRQAQKAGSTLKDLAVELGLDVRKLYELRRRLVRKGAFGAPVPREAKAPAFLPVRVAAAAPVPGGTAVRCRLVHPSGWVLECEGLPPARWMSAVVAGEAHAAT